MSKSKVEPIRDDGDNKMMLGDSMFKEGLKMMCRSGQRGVGKKGREVFLQTPRLVKEGK